MAAFGFETAKTIINDAAVEIGLAESTDPYASDDQNIAQLRRLLDSAGRFLIREYNFEKLVKEHSITTDSSADDGTYTLPTDFLRMIPQTGWERVEDVPLVGPLSAQDWAYLQGRDLAQDTIYASFRIQQGTFTLFPNDPVPDALQIYFEYISKNWVLDAGGTTEKDRSEASADIVWLDPTMITMYLKYRWLSAKGFPTDSAMTEFNRVAENIFGTDGSSEVINAGGYHRGHPYLQAMRNTPDTGYGSS